MIRACEACGVELERQDRDHCDDCMAEEVRTSAMAFREAGRAMLAALPTSGYDPAHTEVANRRRGSKAAQHQRKFRQWNAEDREAADPEVFRTEMLPKLQSVSLGAMARAAGLS